MLFCGMRIYPLALVVLLAASAGAKVVADEATMRAAVVSAGTIRVREVARPVAAPGQILVRMRYASVNPADWKSAGGKPEDPEMRASAARAAAAGVTAAQVPGADGSGLIAGIGPGVAGFKIGDQVIVWSPTGGTYAQYVAVPFDNVAHKPDNLSFAEAAGMAHAGLAAWNMLIDQAHVRSGESVLVLGGAGGVGSATVQIAKIKGARVFATASARNGEYLKSLGADTIVDYTTQHFEDQLRNIDIAINTVDLDNAYRALAVLRRGGYLLSAVGLPDAAHCAARIVTCSGPSRSGTPVHLALGQIATWAREGRFKVNVDRSFALNEVLQAWQYSQAGHTRGKSVIRIDD
jgi:NADPH:quinone reductase-like Zn-dependent oxidoreductase